MKRRVEPHRHCVAIERHAQPAEQRVARGEKAVPRRAQPLADIAMQAMAKNPDERFATMNDLIHAIREFRGKALESAGK